MRPRIVGYGSCGAVPPNSLASCLAAFESGADAFALDVCETGDGVVVVGNRRALRLIAPRFGGAPSWSVARAADLGVAFGGARSCHRVMTVGGFFEAVGPLALHLMITSPLRQPAVASLIATLRDRTEAATTLVAPAAWIVRAGLPPHVRRVAFLKGGEAASEVSSLGVDAIAVPSRSLPFLGRLEMAKVALHCNSRAAVLSARLGAAAVVHTERPDWFCQSWQDDSAALFRQASAS